MTAFKTIAIDNIVRRGDARPTDYNKLMEMEDSVRRLGLLNPLTVRPNSRGEFEILAGGHRFAACHAAGFHEIACHVVNLDDDHAKLAMLDENLCRNELTPAERSAATAERKAIYERMHPETRNGSIAALARHGSAKLADASFTASTAAATGRSERSIQRDAERGEKITPEAMAEIRGSRLDNGAYLDEVKSVPRERQVEKVRQDQVAPPPKPKPSLGEAFTRFVDLAADMGKLLAKDIVAGLPAANRRADLRNHVRSLQDLLERVDEILEGGAE